MVDAALPRLVAIMGSGETSPTMVKTHRALLGRLGPPPVPAVILDTPVGFQANAGEISTRAVEYFAESVGADVEVASLRSAAEADEVAVESFLAAVRRARYVFAGPGSPSYALRQWEGTGLPSLLTDKVLGGGCITFASAAALTLGVATVPVYEIYKVGEDPRWLDGLDVLGAIGIRAAVIPHFDNAEGGSHDTRFCYLGERRLAALERELADDVFVLGVDEHTGCILDVDAGTASVVGLGTVTVRKHGRSTVLASGATVTLDELCEAADRAGSGPVGGAGRVGPSAADDGGPGHVGDDDRGGAPATARTPLLAEVARLEDAFEAAVAAGDVRAAVGAVLGLDTVIVEWSRDVTQSDERDHARRALRTMIVRLGELAEVGAADPRERVAPLVEALLSVRSDAREAGRWASADSVRDRLVEAGIEIRDTPDGTVWEVVEGG